MENFNEELNKTESQNAEDMAARTRKNVIIGAIMVAVVIAACIIFYVVSSNGAAKADELVGRADIEQNDSIALQYYKEAAEAGHKSGNRAKLNVAIKLYEEGNYEEALKYLNEASISNSIMEAGQYSLMGDCYVNLDKYDEALAAYAKAIKAAKKNPQIVPFVLIKEANIYRAQQNYQKEYEAYQTVITDYPEFCNTLRFDIRIYAERAKAQAAAAAE